MSLLEKLEEYKKTQLVIGFGALALSVGVTRYFFPREVSNIGVYDKDLDGYVDVIEDKNWNIVLTNKSEYLIPVEKLNPDVRICYFSESIPMENIGQEFAQRTRKVLEDCINKN